MKKIAELRDAQPLELANTLAEQRGTLAEKRRGLDQAVAANWELEAILRSGQSADVNAFKRTTEALADPNKGDQRRQEYDTLIKTKLRVLKKGAKQSPTSEQQAHKDEFLLLMSDHWECPRRRSGKREGSGPGEPLDHTHVSTMAS